MYNPNLHFHFIGIGGSGMSGLAEILLGLGFKVSGSDLRAGEACGRLERLGAQVFIGHAAENIPPPCSLVVYSSAVDRGNPEMVEAKRRGLPVIRRAEVLAELMRLKYGVAVAGSHGKTSTTSMTAAILEKGGLDPTVIIGGVVKTQGSGGRLGRGAYLVAETDESDRSFLLLKPTIAVVTNIDAEHLQAYKSMADLERSFRRFVEAVPFYGLAVLCVDDHKVRDLCAAYRGRKVTYGFSLDAQFRAVDFHQERGVTAYTVLHKEQPLLRAALPLPGRHFALNSLAAIAVGLEFGIAPQTIADALNDFAGVERRLEVEAEVGGVTVINDYGHHPTEIRASLRAIREHWQAGLRRLHVVFQPHRYSRTRDCFVDFINAFDDADEVLITEIYPAGEPPLEGVSGEILSRAIDHPRVRFVGALDQVLPDLAPRLCPGDVVAFMGAGSIGALAAQAAALLESRSAAVNA